MKKAIITGGGTGGHIYPALAVANRLKEKGWEILYIGSRNGLEGRIIPPAGLPYKEVSVSPLPRKLTPRLFGAIYKTTGGLFQAMRILKDYQPDVVLGTGGFVAGPVVLAASLRGFPTVIHEQNVYPGFTNKLLSYRVDKIALNFADADQFFSRGNREKLVVTGNPIRDIIINTERKEGLQEFKFSPDKKTLLVFGGSQGAMSINKAMIEIYKYYENSRDLQIIHLTGEKTFKSIMEEVKKRGIDLEKNRNYRIMPYLTKMELAYAVADLIIYRAGATGIAEITTKGIPAILVPYPYAAENHQEYNARNLEKHGAAVMISDDNLSGEVLIKKIEELIKNERKLKEMAKNSKELGQPAAAEKLVKLIEEVALSR